MTTSSKPRAAKRRKPKAKAMPIAKAKKDITLFELGLLPFLYLEEFIKLIINRLSPSALS